MESESLNELAEVEGNTTQTDEDGLKHFIGPSVLITVFGTITNLLSLSYFITQRNFNNRKSRTEIINNRLFIVLNVFDILVCVFLSVRLLFKILSDTKRKWISISFITAVETTGFTTCLLSVIRAISITRPRQHLNAKMMIGAIMIYCAMMSYFSYQDPGKNKPETIARFSILSGLFFVVIFCNIVCIAKLAHSKVASWKREATITMGILSAVYCVFNVGFLVNYGNRVFDCGFKDSSCFSPTLQAISMYILLPMNSASNPVVYFLRNREMRRYLKNVWRKMTCGELKQEEGPGKDMTISNIDRTEVTEVMRIERCSNRQA